MEHAFGVGRAAFARAGTPGRVFDMIRRRNLRTRAIKMLVLDEATSALDNLTENAVMNAVNGLARLKTVVLIAHRLSTVRNCDRIIVLDGPSAASAGSYSARQTRARG